MTDGVSRAPIKESTEDALTKLRRATEGTQAWNRDVFMDFF
jgi:hypothetical protein